MSGPGTSFAELGLPDAVVRALGAAGFEAPLESQRLAIPPQLAGEDVVLSARTGSGKTLAYLAPLLAQLVASASRGRGTRAVVLAPTRELAHQIDAVARPLAHALSLDTALVHGGVRMGGQIARLRAGLDLIVATPGRLRDLLHRGHGDLSSVEVVVMDESDRLLERGFAADVEALLAELPSDRRTVLCSATMDRAVAGFVRHRLRHAKRIEVHAAHALPSGLVHEWIEVRQPLKRLLLVHLLEQPGQGPTLVFTSRRHRAGALAQELVKAGIPAESLHADLSQSDRGDVLRRFRDGEFPVLVATDLAERGLDVPRLSRVIHFDPPNTEDIYLHRVGRTARLDRDGVALSLVARSERDKVLRMAKELGFELGAGQDHGFDHKQRPSGPDPLVDPTVRRRKADKAAKALTQRPKGPLDEKSFWAHQKAKRAKRKPKGAVPEYRPKKKRKPGGGNSGRGRR